MVELLFEDNAEHGYGMYTAQEVIREALAEKTRKLLAVDWTYAPLKEAAQKWLDTMNDGSANKEASMAYRCGSGRGARSRLRLRRLQAGCGNPEG